MIAGDEMGWWMIPAALTVLAPLPFLAVVISDRRLEALKDPLVIEVSAKLVVWAALAWGYWWLVHWLLAAMQAE